VDVKVGVWGSGVSFISGLLIGAKSGKQTSNKEEKVEKLVLRFRRKATEEFNADIYRYRDLIEGIFRTEEADKGLETSCRFRATREFLSLSRGKARNNGAPYLKILMIWLGSSLKSSMNMYFPLPILARSLARSSLSRLPPPIPT